MGTIVDTSKQIKNIKMGSSQSSSEAPAEAASTPAIEEKKPACKPCCACPETRKIRDACIIENGEENCSKEIEAHKECMRQMGFKV